MTLWVLRHLLGRLPVVLWGGTFLGLCSFGCVLQVKHVETYCESKLGRTVLEQEGDAKQFALLEDKVRVVCALLSHRYAVSCRLF